MRTSIDRRSGQPAKNYTTVIRTVVVRLHLARTGLLIRAHRHLARATARADRAISRSYDRTVDAEERGR